ncbi:MAG: hypothetical protein R2688_02180 [Fimbriimonadaceae bacterium]|nr:hypothetical protein [Armatimonadota bacterium]
MAVEKTLEGAIIELSEKPFGRSVFGRISAIEGNDFVVELPDREKRKAEGIMELSTFHDGLWIRGDIMVTEPSLRGFVFRFMRDPKWAQLPTMLETCAPSLMVTVGEDIERQTTLAAIGKGALAVYGSFPGNESGLETITVECGPTKIRLDVEHFGVIGNDPACATIYKSCKSCSVQEVLWNKLFASTEAHI